MYFAIYSQTAKIKNESNNTIHELSVPLIIPNFCCAKKEKKIGERKIYIYIYLTSTVRFKSFDIEVRGLRNGRVADYPPAETFFFFMFPILSVPRGRPPVTFFPCTWLHEIANVSLPLGPTCNQRRIKFTLIQVSPVID